MVSVEASWRHILQQFLTEVAPDKNEWFTALADVESHATLNLLRSACGSHPAPTSSSNTHCLLFLGLSNGSTAHLPPTKRRTKTVQSNTARLQLRTAACFASCPSDPDAARQVSEPMVLQPALGPAINCCHGSNMLQRCAPLWQSCVQRGAILGSMATDLRRNRGSRTIAASVQKIFCGGAVCLVTMQATGTHGYT